MTSTGKTSGGGQPYHWTGFGVSVGAGIGMVVGLVIGGGAGMAVGIAMGAGVGVIVGSALDGMREAPGGSRRDTEPRS